MDNIAFASGYNYLFAAFRGVSVQDAGDGAVFVYNLVNLVHEVELNYATDTGRNLMQRYPINRLVGGQLLPLQENLQGLNGAIDIRADYRIIRYDGNAARILFGVPFVQTLDGRYLTADGAVLDYVRDRYGDFYHAIRDASGNAVSGTRSSRPTRSRCPRLTGRSAPGGWCAA